jgi:hypothetical protein
MLRYLLRYAIKKDGAFGGVPGEADSPPLRPEPRHLEVRLSWLCWLAPARCQFSGNIGRTAARSSRT